MRLLLATTLFLFAACSTDSEPEAITSGATTGGSDTGGSDAGDSDAGGGDSVEALRANIAETAARDEHDAKKVTVSHILIAFKGASRSKQTRSKEEAEVLTAELLARALAGEDFGALMREYSNDPGGGTYTMSTDGSAGFPRSGMAPAFGDTGWRLEVDQIGVAAYHPQRSGFGWHIIKRVE